MLCLLLRLCWIIIDLVRWYFLNCRHSGFWIYLRFFYSVAFFSSVLWYCVSVVVGGYSRLNPLNMSTIFGAGSRPAQRKSLVLHPSDGRFQNRHATAARHERHFLGCSPAPRGDQTQVPEANLRQACRKRCSSCPIRPYASIPRNLM